MLGRDSRQRQRQAIETQARACGLSIRSFEELHGNARGATDEIRQLFALAVAGSARTSTTSIDVYWLDSSAGTFLLAQPYQNSDALVGEYHLLLSGGLPQPIALCRASFFRKKWATAEDKALAQRLEGEPALKAAVKALPWSRHTTRGSIDLDWTVQLASLGDETSQLVVQAGNSPLALEDPLLERFVNVAHALAPLLQPGTPAQGRYFEPRFDRLFFDR